MLWLHRSLAVASAAYTFTFPGEHARYVTEIVSYYTNYAMLGLFTKLEIGFTNAAGPLFYRQNFVAMLFCIVLCMAVWHKYKNKLYRLLALYPAVVCFMFGYMGTWLQNRVPVIGKLINCINPMGSIQRSNSNLTFAYVPLLVL